MLLYIHVPFCRAKCGYCAFYSVPLPEGRAGADLVRAYLTSLIGEMRFWAERLENPVFDSVFFGGGTPSLLPARAIEGIVSEARKLFTIPASAEVSAEANPDSALADGWLYEARNAGVNRLSLGVQSLHDTDLALLGRCHDARAAEAAFETARSAGFSNISLDFIWGLPGPVQGGAARPQSQRQWLNQLRRAVDLRPEHISAYGLTVEPGTPLEKAVAQGLLALPEEKAQASMFLAGTEFLESRGYMQYEISNFARMGFACRHNSGYWDGADYLGLGPAAVSTLKRRRKNNPADIDAWIAMVAKGETGLVEELDKGTRLREKLMLGLRTVKGLDLKQWQDESGNSFLKEHRATIALLQREGLASVRQGRLRLSRAGMLVSDAIVSHLFAAMDRSGSGDA